MSLKLAFALAAFASLIGVAIGYFLRVLISLGKRGSMELKIKQMMFEAKDEVKKITNAAEKKAEEIIKASRAEMKESEEKNKRTEDRLIKKEELLDKRQTDIDKEVENIKQKITEIRAIRE